MRPGEAGGGIRLTLSECLWYVYPEGLLPTSLKGMSHRGNCPSPDLPVFENSSSPLWRQSSIRSRPAKSIQSSLPRAPLLKDNPTPLSRLCCSCQSEPTLRTTVITISNRSQAPHSVCHMSPGLKLDVMTFSLLNGLTEASIVNLSVFESELNSPGCIHLRRF